ncbi:hypothetical protein BDP55DRAFT_638557 [Colletotrichum godetiae]|uniref:Uncharacterized protein n=1 Tax=Colletotrichum godetiae TaxID=1209918 RepID=A0AAJ0ENK1_9PEZI|nr:uncharacterized protein BDP55DRAFT_638557 [Colletotrichum godetiae]KAK1657662.1 hypothetical protein BDP55DRAFT_638557 [Colletotrichum godetiae]
MSSYNSIPTCSCIRCNPHTVCLAGYTSVPAYPMCCQPVPLRHQDTSEFRDLFGGSETNASPPLLDLQLDFGGSELLDSIPLLEGNIMTAGELGKVTESLAEVLARLESIERRSVSILSPLYLSAYIARQAFTTSRKRRHQNGAARGINELLSSDYNKDDPKEQGKGKGS